MRSYTTDYRRARSVSLTAALGAALVVGLAASARAQPLVHPVPVEGSLAHFHAALAAIERDPSRRVRVMHFGDSNVAADLWTAVAREALGARFGHGGSGYLVPPPHGSAHRGGVRLRTVGAWQSRRRGFARDFGPRDGLWGLAGVAVEPVTPGARVIATIPDGPARVVEVHLLGRPSPRSAVTITIDGGDPERVSLERATAGLVLVRRALAPGPHRVVVRHAAGRPRLLGIVVERERGVVYDVLGINGHRASAIEHWDEELLRAQLATRPPDLIVLSYGGNEALDPDLTLEAYEARTRRAVGVMRRLAPRASCLLVGPLATLEEHAPRMRAVAETQRRLARELGCAFWDASRTSGGPGTLGRWLRHPDMVAGDRLHLGREGYTQVGRVFVDAILP